MFYFSQACSRKVLEALSSFFKWKELLFFSGCSGDSPFGPAESSPAEQPLFLPFSSLSALRARMSSPPFPFSFTLFSFVRGKQRGGRPAWSPLGSLPWPPPL